MRSEIQYEFKWYTQEKQALFRFFRSKVLANLVTKGKSYTSNEEFCVNDSFVVLRNSELLAGKQIKNL